MGINLNKTKQQLHCFELLNNTVNSMKQFEYSIYCTLNHNLQKTQKKLQLLQEALGNCQQRKKISNNILTIGFGDDGQMGRLDHDYSNCDYLVGKKHEQDRRYLCSADDFNILYNKMYSLMKKNNQIRLSTYDIHNNYKSYLLEINQQYFFDKNMPCFLEISPQKLQILLVKHQIKKIFIENQIIEHFCRYNIMNQAYKVSEKIIMQYKRQYNRISCQVQSEQNIWQNSLIGDN